MDLQILTAEDVLKIHEYLVRDFASTSDPIDPPGARSMALLESAVGRQVVGLENTLKYPKPIDNAATLTYGICSDHPFHNGNKRAALVAMLVHLDRNKLSLFEIRQPDLYSMILDVAKHTLLTSGRQREKTERVSSDDEVKAISHWISAHADKVTRGEKPITYKELRSILRSFGYEMENPKGNIIEIVRYEVQKQGLFRREKTLRRHVTAISFPGEGKTVAIRDIKFVRKTCHLTEEYGVDSTSFYNDTVVIDAFINRYRTILRRLARK
jgi:death-on-curing protein